MSTYRNTSHALPELAHLLLTQGDKVSSRNGRTVELLHQHITLTHPLEREVINPNRRASLPAQIAETAWLLAGRDDIGWLTNYLKRAPEFSDDGKVWRGAYGPRIRSWETRDRDRIDQVAYVLDTLREHALSRRAVITIYDPAVDTSPGKDIPCNNWLAFSNRLGRLHLHVATRSNDLWWGWSGINAFAWSVLLEVAANMLGLEVGQLSFSVTSLHLYDRHWETARRVHESAREASPVATYAALNPSARFNLGVGTTTDDLDRMLTEWFRVEALIRDGDRAVSSLHAEIEAFPEPMMQEWLYVLAWWWRHDDSFLLPLVGTPLAAAATASPGRPPHPRDREPAETAEASPATPERVSFLEYVSNLHREKHEVYGDSWKRRGEMLGILANIARKVDRLGVAGGGDTSADTAIDLLCYLVKYRLWLTDHHGVPTPAGVHPRRNLSDWAEPVTEMLFFRHGDVLDEYGDKDSADLIGSLRHAFEVLEQSVADKYLPGRAEHVDKMIEQARALADRLWHHEQWKAANSTRSWKGYGDGDA